MVASILARDVILSTVLGLFILTLLFVLVRLVSNGFRKSTAGAGLKVPKRRCKYCLFGRAHLIEQKARVEADDLVSVRCWVCASCGLPHWTVTRSSVLNSVKSDK